MTALTEAYPGIAGLPRAGIARLPTAVDTLAASGLTVGRLSVKRDDRTSPAYGGNKVRKLDFLLGKARAEGRRSVLTFGAYGSNHALATAVHAGPLGIDAHVILTPQAPTSYARATLLAHARLGTALHPVDGFETTEEAARVREELRRRDGIEPLTIPIGGSSELGAVGFVEAAFEALAQGTPEVVYVAGGSLGTAVGLAVGFAAAGAATQVVAVRVTPATVANEAIAARLTEGIVNLLRAADRAFPSLSRADLAFELREGFFEPGYATITTPAREAVAFARALGIGLETTYTGRAFAALLADAAAGHLAGRDVLFWDTYNSAPMPAAGAPDALPPVLREYLVACEGQ